MKAGICALAAVLLVSMASVAWADHDITVPYTAAAGSATVDGDLSDWAGASWILLDEVYAGGPTDMSGAKYALRWSDADNLLYVAVEVTDTQQNLVPGYVTWNGQDDIEISVDAGDNTAYFESPPCLGQQIIVGADSTGGDWIMGAWGNAVGTDLVPAYAAVVTGDVIRYEASITPYSYYAGWGADGEQAVVDLAGGLQIGFDIVAVTKLNDGSYGMMTNNLVGGKFQQGASLQKWVLEGDAPILLPGDANGDGTVNIDDFVALKNGFGVGSTWAEGDFNGDGAVNIDDFVILKNNFGASAVPEPATMSLLALGGLSLIRRRR